MAQWRADEGAVDSHFGHSRIDVVSMWGAIFRNVGGKHLLQGREGTGCEHFGAEWVCLQLSEVGLVARVISQYRCWAEGISIDAYRKVALGALASSQSFADLVHDLVLATSWDGSVPNGLFLELDRHAGSVAKAWRRAGDQTGGPEQTVRRFEVAQTKHTRLVSGAELVVW